MNLFKKILRSVSRVQKEPIPPCPKSGPCGFEGWEKYAPLVGEFVWHSLTSDTTLDTVSDQHFQHIVERIDRWAVKNPTTILEIGAYAHSTGYKLQEKYGSEVTLFDLSESTLRLGRERIAFNNDTVELVAGDFHDLPFADGYFELVYIFAALHHSHDYKQVLREIHRVMAPEALLCVFQEPFKREACFYKFRTNRLGRLTNFEKALESESLLTTVAEPSPGSRDEILFGMIENQEISLHDWTKSLCGQICEPLEVTPHYTGKVGILGDMWLSWARDTVSCSSLAQKMARDFSKRLDSVRPAFDLTAKGLGFSLPDKKEVTAKFALLAKQFLSLPQDHESPENQAQVAAIFGGSLTFVGRKRATASDNSTAMRRRQGKYRAIFPVVGGVRIAFFDVSLRNLSQSKSCIPFFDAVGRDSLCAIFPAPHWVFDKQDNGFWTMGLSGSRGEIVLPETEGRMLVVLRINLMLAPFGGSPFRLNILYGEKNFVYTVYQDEAILFRGVMGSCAESRNKKVVVTTEFLDCHTAAPVAGEGVKVYYAGAFIVRNI